MTAEQLPGRCPVAHQAPNLVDPTVHSDGDPHQIWRALRRHDPVSWHDVGDGLGFWSVTRYGDSDLVLRDYATFTSERGTMIDLLGTDDPAGGSQLAVTDPPRHSVMREPLQRALTVRAVERSKHVIRRQIVRLLRPLADGATFDFADAMLAMPMAVTGILMGLPPSDWDRLTRLTTVCIAPDDPEYRHPRGRRYTLEAAHRELFAYFQDIVEERDRNHGDDLISVLLQTRFDGRRMSQGEIVSNCYSMLLGANVTTPHAPNFAMDHLMGTPYLDDWVANPGLIRSGVEEALRWASPITYFMRYATRDVVLSGTQIHAGDAVVVWIASANRDEEVFADPFTFDIRRRPNRHIAFGAGAHHCVGHSVARVTLRLLFTELFGNFTDFAPAGPAQRLASNFVSGYKHLPMTARKKG
ncbi:cytochrome P450 [Micromonospora sonneratiae]|uniref:Cytochrome P450 n=1 Tax=Micromonospora sonneratiae TaxID=1184706 RepID=A0ABW3YQE6_9ACTN